MKIKMKINLRSLSKNMLKIAAVLGYIYVVVKTGKRKYATYSFDFGKYSYGKNVVKSLEDAAMDACFDSDKVEYARKIKSYAEDKADDVKYYAAKALSNIAEEVCFDSDRKEILNLMTDL